jgi:DNA repair exonuclease SbcCD ATPase subunit
MIIKSLYCKNFMKFRELNLREIPDKGLIGIIGENEAGKSTIGEAISFGLFGKCTRGDVQHLGDIISWGEAEGFVQVKVNFGNEQFILSRHFSSDGISLGIRNETLGSDLNEEGIQEFYRERLKSSFKEFRYSSYVAQKELAIIQTHREDRLDVINSMLGLKKLDNTEKFLDSEVEVSRRRVAEVDEVLENLRDSLAEINEELAEKKVVVDEIKVHEAWKNEIVGSIADSEKKIEHLNNFGETDQRHRLLNEKIIQLEGNLEKQEEKTKAFATLDSQFKELEEQLERAKKSLADKEHSKVDLDKQFKECEQKEKRSAEREKLENVCESLRRGHGTKRELLASLAETLRMVAEERAEIERQLQEIESEFEAENKALAEIDVLREKLQAAENRKAHLERNTAGVTDVRTRLDNSAKIKALVENVNQEREDLNASCYEDENRVKTELGKVEDSLLELGERLVKLTDVEDIINSQKAILAKRRGKEKLFGALFLFSSIGLAGWVIATAVMTYLGLGIFPVILLISAIVSRAKTNKLQKELDEEIASTQEKKDGIDEECRVHNENKIRLKKRLAEIVRTGGLLKEIDLTERFKIGESLGKIRELPERPFEFNLMKILDFLQENDMDGPLGEYHGSLEETLRKLEGDLEELKEVEETCSELNTAILKLDTRRESIHTFEKKIDDLRKRLSKKEAEERKFANSRERLEAETRKLDDEMGEVESQLKGFVQTDMKAGNKSEIQSRVQENSGSIVDLKGRILKTQQEINFLKRQKVDHQQLLEEKDQLEKELAGVKGEFKELEKQLSDAEFSQEKLNGLREQLKNCNLQMFEILDAIARKKTLLERFQDTESKKKQVSAKTKEVEQEEKQLRENMLYFPEVIKLYGQTRKNIIRKIKPQIERYFSIYLPKLTNNRYKKVSLQEDFSLRIFSDEKNDYVPIKNLSGGTEDQILLMLRLAFSKALFPGLQEVDGNPAFHQFLFLDEPISSFDQKRQNAFIELLRMMEKSYQQIFVISHISELENKMDYFIKAEASSNVLEVERL